MIRYLLRGSPSAAAAAMSGGPMSEPRSICNDMPKTKAEILEYSKITQRERRAKIREDVQLHEEEKKKERERYHRRKARGGIVPIRDLTPEQRNLVRKRNRDNYKAYYRRQKLKKLGINPDFANFDSQSETDVVEIKNDPLLSITSTASGSSKKRKAKKEAVPRQRQSTRLKDTEKLNRMAQEEESTKDEQIHYENKKIQKNPTDHESQEIVKSLKISKDFVHQEQEHLSQKEFEEHKCLGNELELDISERNPLGSDEVEVKIEYDDPLLNVTQTALAAKGQVRKRKSKEEILVSQRLAQRRRRARIKLNTELHEEVKRKDRERYYQKKAEGGIVPVRQLSPTKRNEIRRRNRAHYKAYSQRQKLKNFGTETEYLFGNESRLSEIDLEIASNDLSVPYEQSGRVLPMYVNVKVEVEIEEGDETIIVFDPDEQD